MRKIFYAVLLAGGSGTRLWPLSRSMLPKQLLQLNEEGTLFQQTIKRLLKFVDVNRIICVTHENHRFEVLRQIEAIQPTLKFNLFTEPLSKNTLPAISWAVGEIVKSDPTAIVGVFPSDHFVGDEEAFRETIEKAVAVARRGYLVTCGIRPTRPETGYGYIHAGAQLKGGGAYQVASFVEKPDWKTARRYLKSGSYYWNSGLFVFPASLFMEELKKWEPSIFEAIRRIAKSRNHQTVKKEYQRLKNISIDYGIMERSNLIALVPARFSWSDLGNWESVYEMGKKNEASNVQEGNVITEETSSSLLISKKGLLATIGLKDMVVIQTDDAVLVSPRNRVQEVRRIVEQIKGQKSPLAETHSIVFRPWGSYRVLEEGPGYKIKKILVRPGQRLSLQSHRRRAEHWVVIEGTAKVRNGKRSILLEANQSTFIPKGEKHRLENPGSAPLTIIEVQTGSYLGEDDIERFDDVYGRTTTA